MSVPIQISNFSDVTIEDTISLTLGSAGDPNNVDFILETAPNITWWKALELRSRSGNMIEHRETQDANHGPQTFSIHADNLVGMRLVLAKAKIFGIHTGMYELQNLSSFRGRCFHFIWQRDEDRDGPVAGFFRDLGNGISTAANGIADIVGTVINSIAELLCTIIETIGNWLSEAFNSIGQFLGQIPGIGIALQFLFHWLSTVISAVFDFVATFFKAGLNFIANVGGGLLRIVGAALGGLFAWDGELFVREAGKGVGDVASGVAGSTVAILAKFLALGQATVFMQLGERPLTPAERDLLTRVYRYSILFDNIRIIEGFAGFYSTNNRPVTIGNRIYMKDVNPASDPGTLVHECCHVWQNQHEGTRYIADALWAQGTLPGMGYSWEDEIARGHFRWQDFNKEAQAQFIQDVFIAGHKIPQTHVAGEFFEDNPIGPDVEFRASNDLTGLARDSIEYVRSTRS